MKYIKLFEEFYKDEKFYYLIVSLDMDSKNVVNLGFKSEKRAIKMKNVLESASMVTTFNVDFYGYCSSFAIYKYCDEKGYNVVTNIIEPKTDKFGNDDIKRIYHALMSEYKKTK